MVRRPLEAPEPQAPSHEARALRLREGMSVKLEHDLADLGVAVRGEKDGIELAVLRLAALCRLYLLLSPGRNGEEAVLRTF